MTIVTKQPHLPLDRLAQHGPLRESGCPVHFIWDGHGVGRPLVRSGFLGILLAGALMSGSSMPALHALAAPGLWSMTAAIGVWAAGQAFSALAKWRLRRR